MISNITNALPILLRNMQNKEENVNPNELKFSLTETMKFFQTILPRSKAMYCLKHMFIDCEFVFKPEYIDALKDFVISLDTNSFLKDFEYEINYENGVVVIRSSYEDLAIFSLIILGSIKNISPEVDVKNQSIFVSLVYHFVKFCIDNDYNVCEIKDLKMLEEYNSGYDKEMLKAVLIHPSSEEKIGTIHFIGIDMNKDILCIFEKYKNVKFSYNQEDASFIISMKSEDWDDFWSEAPQYLKDEFLQSKEKEDIH